MGRKCFISYKDEDRLYKKYLQENVLFDIVDKSLNSPIDSFDEDYILSKIRRDHLSDSTVTIHLIGAHGAEAYGSKEQKYIKGELRGSLFDGENNPRSGILGIVLPEMHDQIYKGSYICPRCHLSHDWIKIDADTTIEEFYGNYYIPHGKCHHFEDDRYCVLVSWSDFLKDPEHYIEQAFSKRTHPVAQKVRVRF